MSQTNAHHSSSPKSDCGASHLPIDEKNNFLIFNLVDPNISTIAVDRFFEIIKKIAQKGDQSSIRILGKNNPINKKQLVVPNEDLSDLAMILSRICSKTDHPDCNLMRPLYKAYDMCCEKAIKSENPNINLGSKSHLDPWQRC